MPLIPWKYLTVHLNLLDYSPEKLEEKLTYHGLETKVVEKNNEKYLEFDILPNRSDLLSWWGIIQEIGIILNLQVKIPIIENWEKQEKVVGVENKTKGCSSFNLGFIKNVEIKESSSSTKEWLKANNINPINNIVDIANLVMLETGQPLHVFDYDTLPEKKLIIRKAYHGEKIKTLNNQELILDSKDIIINSGEKIIDLAGIIGAQETSVTSNTKNILIECASFNHEFIKKTTKRLSISTNASRFFSRKASSINSPKQVINYAVSLISKSCQKDSNLANLFSYWEEKNTPLVIAIDHGFIVKKTGQFLDEQTIENIWQKLGLSYRKEEKIYYITVPLSRTDITSSEDLLEELLRTYDYNKIISSLPKDFSAASFDENKKKNEEWKKIFRSYLTGQGWQEIITYSLISEEMKKNFKEEDKSIFYQLLMPKNDYHKYYRQSLVVSHLKTLNYNFTHQNEDLFFFEISSVYGPSHKEELLVLSGSGNFLNQPLHKLNSRIDFFWLKGTLENIFDLLRINSEISFSHDSNNHRNTEIFLGKDKIGFLTRIESSITKKHQINEPIFIAQISLTKIFNYLDIHSSKFVYRPVSNFPISEKDLSFVFPQKINYSKVIEEIIKSAKGNLQEVKVFDIYQNDELIKERKKSVSFRLVFQSLDKTMEIKEIEKVLGEIAENIEKKFAAKLRS